jgi:hypothetical protein
MKTTYILGLLFIFNLPCFGQNARTLEETKSYIVKMISEYGRQHALTQSKLTAEFDGDLLKISRSAKTSGQTHGIGSLYNLVRVYKYKGPIREPGDKARIIVWADRLLNSKSQKWKKAKLDMDLSNYDVGEQLLAAFMHLNELLLAKKPAIEKF